jgi:thermitase
LQQGPSLKLVAVIVLVIGALTGSGAALAAGGSPPARDSTTILVRFTSPSAAASAIAHEGDTSEGKVGSHVSIVKLRRSVSVDASVAAYERRPGVVYAEPNYIATAFLASPNDPSYSSQWGLPAIAAPAGWSMYPGSYTSSGGPPIAILDTGVDASHPDLTAKVESSLGANCITGTCGAGSSSDDFGHGTHVAGIAAALTNNSTGVAGVGISSPIIPVKVLDSSGNGSYASITNGINWAVSHDARVINMSLGGTAFSQTLCDAVSNAIANGVVVVAAAGNSGTSQASYPAACPGAIGVAATNSSGGYPSWSNYGSPNVFVSAPGVSIYSTMWTGATQLGSACSGHQYCLLDGTSMATPFVAGLAALMEGENEHLTPTALKLLLAQTADKIGGVSYGSDPYGTCTGCSWNAHYGYGQIDVEAALAAEAPPPAISSFSPDVDGAGGSVTLTGSGYSSATSVSFGLVSTSFTIDSATQITAVVPAGVAYGRWRVTGPGGTAVSALVGSVPLPTITGISSQHAGTGSTVTITGGGFQDATGVTLGFVPVGAYTVNSPTSITATIPSGLEYGRFRVTTPVGTGVSATVFTVLGGSPSGLVANTEGGPTGSSVTLTGGDFTGASAVSLGFVAATFTLDSTAQITATVPAGVSYGRWRVTTPTGTLASQLVFSIPAPVIAGVSARSGGSGTTVTITGTDFRNVTAVTLGNIPSASYTVISPTTIQAVVPSGTDLAYGRWRVLSANGTGVSDVVYTVTG